MVDDPQIARTALGMKRIFKDEAASECLLLMERFRRRDDLGGLRVWESIYQAVRRLEEERRLIE